MRLEIENRIRQPLNTNIIKLNNMQIQDCEVHDIMALIKEIQSDTVVVNLDSNHLQDEGAIVLSEHLRDLSKLEELSIQFNQIGRDGAIALLSLKKEFASLRISFHGNKIHNVAEMMEIERIALESGDKADGAMSVVIR